MLRFAVSLTLLVAALTAVSAITLHRAGKRSAEDSGSSGKSDKSKNSEESGEGKCWSKWSSWSECQTSDSPDGDFVFRTRLMEGNSCCGHTVEHKPCQDSGRECTWALWSAWSDCYSKDGADADSEMVRFRERSPRDGAKGCCGENIEHQECYREPQALISGSTYHVPDSALTASSSWGGPFLHTPNYSRLYTTSSSINTGAWASGQTDGNQWIQVEFQEPFYIEQVATQGRFKRPDQTCCDQWVVTFYLKYGDDADSLTDYTEGGLQKVFTTAQDSNTVKVDNIAQPFSARVVRLVPLTWYRHIAMRWELLGTKA